MTAASRDTTSSSAVACALAGRVAILVTNVATGILMARLLGPAGRGAASAVALWPIVASGVLGLGLPVAIRYNVRRNVDDADALLSVALCVSVLLGMCGAVAGVFFVPSALHAYPPEIVRFARWMMIFTPFMTTNALLQGFLESKGRFARATSMIYLPPAGTLVLILVAYAVHHVSIYTVAIAYELPFTCVTIATVVRLRDSIRRPADVVRRAGLLLHFGLRAYGLDILNTLSMQVGQLIVVGLLSAESFGLYSVALSASRTIGVVAASLNTILFPKASELEPRAAVELVAKASRIVFAANVAAGALLIAAMPFLIRLAYGAAYVSNVRLAQILTVEIVVGATVATLTQAFMATGKPGLVTTFQAIGLATTVPLMLVLIPRVGLVGAAYALLGSTLLRFVLVLASYPLFLDHPVPTIVPTSEDVRDLRRRFARPPTASAAAPR